VGQGVKTPPFHGGNRGSNPLRVISWTLSSAGRASALQAEGRRFDPVSVHHLISPLRGSPLVANSVRRGCSEYKRSRQRGQDVRVSTLTAWRRLPLVDRPPLDYNFEIVTSYKQSRVCT